MKPDTDRNVLVWVTRDDPVPAIGYYVAGLGYSSQGRIHKDVYWWCEIPEPPKDAE